MPVFTGASMVVLACIEHAETVSLGVDGGGKGVDN